MDTLELSDSSNSYHNSPVRQKTNSKNDELSKLLNRNGSSHKNSTSGFTFKVPLQGRRSPSKAKGKEKDPREILNVLAAQTLKIASINGLGELDKLENDLEEEIRYDNRSPAKTRFGRIRQEGQHRIHSKFVLLVVVALNILDCLLVMAELTLDFHHVSHLLRHKQDMIDDFSENMQKKYSPVLDDLRDTEDYHLFQEILDGYVTWAPNITATDFSMADVASQCVSFVTSAAEYSNQSLSSFMSSLLHSNWSSDLSLSKCFRSAGVAFDPANQAPSDTKTYVMTNYDVADKTLINVAHKLHYISISILAVLVLLLLVKVICNGKRFFKRRMQVFDGTIILISFIVDLVFIEGVTVFEMNDFVIILTFLLPWRIIRVLNSLIVAVLDKQRLNMKIIYTQKKKISRNLSEVNNKVEVLQRQIQVLQGLCSSRGIHEGDVRKVLGTEKHDKHEKKGGHRGGGGLASMMALGKLAFQAADALAPMPSEYGSNRKLSSQTSQLGSSTPTTPVLLSPVFLGSSMPLATTGAKTTPPMTPTIPEVIDTNRLRKINNNKTTSKSTSPSPSGPLSNGTRELFNGGATITPNGIGNCPTAKENPALVIENEDRLAINRRHSVDTDSVRTESEDLRDPAEDGGEVTDVSTSQVTLHSSPGALGVPASDDVMTTADSVAIQIDDLSPDRAALSSASSPNSSSPDSRPRANTPDEGHINDDDANSKL